MSITLSPKQVNGPVVGGSVVRTPRTPTHHEGPPESDGLGALGGVSENPRDDPADLQHLNQLLNERNAWPEFYEPLSVMLENNIRGIVGTWSGVLPAIAAIRHDKWPR